MRLRLLPVALPVALLAGTLSACGGGSGSPLSVLSSITATPPATTPAVVTPPPFADPGAPTSIPPVLATRRPTTPAEPGPSPSSTAVPTTTPSPRASATTGRPSPSPSAPGADPTDPAATDTREITVKITGTRVSPPPSHIDVTKGTTVVLTVTSDAADELHVHGYDLEEPLVPGAPLRITFVASQVGSFDVETHESGLTLFQLRVR